MSNNIIQPNGVYLSTQFKGSNGAWKLIGSESTVFGKPNDCLDEFKNIETGELMVTTRSKVYKMAEKGSIFL